MGILGILALGLFVLICSLIGQGTNTYAAIAAGGFFIGSIVLYFSPSIVANSRKHKNLTALFVLNLFLGWTVIGWVAALVWAYTGSEPEPIRPSAAAVESTHDSETWRDVSKPPPGATKKCPFCAEEVKAEAIKCKHCQSDLTQATPAA